MSLKSFFLSSIAAAAVGLAGSASVADGHATQVQGYALFNEGNSLVVMSNLMDAGANNTVALSETMSAIAYRPVTGDLLGFADGHIYAIDPATGALTDLSASFADDATIASGAAVAFDFNNKIDAVRAVSSAGDNLVYFPEGFGDNDERAGSVRRFTSLAYAEGDAKAGKTPRVFANAYTNAVNGAKAADTFQYALDAETDALISLANNAGTLETIAPITVNGKAADLAASGGLDIVSAAEGDNTAYAVLQMEGEDTAGLYEVNLETGAATKIAKLSIGGVTGFAASLGGA